MDCTNQRFSHSPILRLPHHHDNQSFPLYHPQSSSSSSFDSFYHLALHAIGLSDFGGYGELPRCQLLSREHLGLQYVDGFIKRQCRMVCQLL